MSPEKNIQPEISNLETFQAFFDGYVSNILANPPNRKPFPKKLRSDPFHSMLYTTEENQFHDEFIRNRLRENVFITGISWNNLPESLQNLLSKAYDSAALDDRKTVSLDIGETGILLHLGSIHSYDLVDWKGGYYTYGVKFLRTKTPFMKELERMIGGKEQNEGEFMLAKLPLSREIRRNSIFETSFKQGKELTEEEKEFLAKCIEEDRSEEFIEIIPSQLIHLQDIARLLEIQRPNAFIYSD